MKKILWDIDGTLLNFDLAETIAIYNIFRVVKYLYKGEMI